MNIRKLIKEEIDDFGWIKDTKFSFNNVAFFSNRLVDYPSGLMLLQLIEKNNPKARWVSSSLDKPTSFHPVFKIIYIKNNKLSYSGSNIKQVDLGEVFGEITDYQIINIDEMLTTLNESEDGLDWIRDIKPGVHLEKGKNYYIDMTKYREYTIDHLRYKVEELFGPIPKTRSYTNWFNNSYIDDHNGLVYLLLTGDPNLVFPQSQGFNLGWTTTANSNFDWMDKTPIEITLEEFFNSYL